MATDKQKLLQIQRNKRRLLTAMGLNLLGVILTNDKDLQEQIEYTQNLYTDEEKKIIIGTCRELIEKLQDTEDRVVL